MIKRIKIIAAALLCASVSGVAAAKISLKSAEVQAFVTPFSAPESRDPVWEGSMLPLPGSGASSGILSSSALSAAPVSSKAASSRSPSRAASKTPSVAPAKKQLQKAIRRVPTKAEEKAEDPEYREAKPAPPPIRDTISVPAAQSKPPVGSKAPGSKASSSNAASSQGGSAIPANGWYIRNGKQYFNLSGTPVKGWQTMDGRKYKFDTATGALLSRTGIDVSSHQGTIDWNAVKADGIEFAMLRVGYHGWGTDPIPGDDPYKGIYKDRCFDQNYAGAKRAGIPVGVYFFSQAITREEAVREAEFVLGVIHGLDIDGPVAFDIENPPDPEARTNDPSLTNQDRTNFCIDFCNTVKAAGYRPQIYTGRNYAYSGLYMNQLTQYSTWIAHYTSENVTNYRYPFESWQYTSSGAVNGISGRVDMDVLLT